MAPKARVTYDEGKFQVEFDVQDYRPEELSIKTEGDVLVVLAKHETKADEGSNSGSYVSKQFEQRFTLPSGVKPEEIASSLSKEGVLTVSAPREIVRRTSQTIGGFNKTRGALEETFNPQSTGADQGLPHPRVKYDDDRFQISLDCKKYKPEELDVKVEGNTIVITAKQEIKEPGGTRTRVFEQKFTLPSGVKADKVASSIDRDGLLTITAPRGNVSASSINQTIEERMDRVMAPSNWDADFGGVAAAGLPSDARRKSTTTTTTSTSSTSNNMMPSGDPFFDREPFGGEPRSLFKHSEALDNTDGVSKVQCEDGKYKILVNVKNYKPEELVIKTVGNSVQVEAKHLEKTSDGNSYSSRNFTQSFSLPKGVDPEHVTSSLNREGQLVIEAPLPQSLKSSASERMVPIRHN